MTSFHWRHRYYVTETRYKANFTRFFPFWAPLNQNFWLRQWDCLYLWVVKLVVTGGSMTRRPKR